MYQKMLFVVFAFVLGSQICSAQDFSRPAIVTSNWNNDPALSLLQPHPVGGLRPYVPYSGLDINWQIAELASELYDIGPGTSMKIAVQRIKILGGTEDGGLQTIPAMRFYFDAGIIVVVHARNGVVTGPLQLSPGVMSVD